MREASKSMTRRFAQDDKFWSKIFKGKGIDIGCGDDPCTRAVDLQVDLTTFDLENGDANNLPFYFAKDYFDFIHSSHSLEHMTRHPWETLSVWSEVLKPGGHMVITVPDFEMYEKGLWPSRFNGDHKWAFHTNPITWLDIVVDMGTCKEELSKHGLDVLQLNRITDGYDPKNREDQTYVFEDMVECAWEILIKKKK